MIVPTYLIITPAFVALNVYMFLYWKHDPENRVTDRRFLLGVACVAVIMIQMGALIQRYQGEILSMLLCVAAVALLIGSFVLGRRSRGERLPGNY
jgi:uncharacterized membrane protein YfcA